MRMVLRIHNHGSQEGKNQFPICNHGSQKLKTNKQITTYVVSGSLMITVGSVNGIGNHKNRRFFVSDFLFFFIFFGNPEGLLLSEGTLIIIIIT